MADETDERTDVDVPHPEELADAPPDEVRAEVQPPPSVDELVCDDGVNELESQRHRYGPWLLAETLERHWSERRDFYTAGNMFLYFSLEQVKRNTFRGPDFFVVVGTERRERKAWVVWEEGGRVPSVVVELLSPSTRKVDRGEKMRIYGQVLRVPEYYLYDPFSAELEGFALAARGLGYEPIAPNPAGRLPCAQVGLDLGLWHGSYRGVEAEWLRWFIRDGEETLPTDEESLATARSEADAARSEADAARSEADAARSEADALAARLATYERRFGVPPEPGRDR